jgi:ABC-2 type transport system ATP-binding protein
MAVIEVKGINKAFGTTQAVRDVSFNVTKGRIFGLLGPNGAGKTTAIRMINHIIIPDSGSITINGTEASPETQRMIGYMPEERGLYKKMKVGEQLIYLARLKGMDYGDAKKIVIHWLDRFKAADWFNKTVGELSKGMSQKVQFIATIAHDPDIYIFDEPFSGLDPINSEMLKEIVLELKSKGKTILFSTHRMEQVEQMCDEICLFNKGRAVLKGDFKGDLREIKKSFGKNTVVLEFQGDARFLDQLQNVRINNKSNNFAEIRLLNGEDAQNILKVAMQYADIYKFERIEPSLTEIFISTVGEDNVNPKELSVV